MIKKSVTELAFVNSRSPLPTVEVDTNAIEQAGFSIHQTVMQVLTRLAAQDPSLRATLFLYATSSVNFREPTWSEFILVAGPKQVLQALGDGFASLRGVKSRFSDHVPSAMALRAFHVEDGLVWEKEDGATWYSAGSELGAPIIEADDDFEEEEVSTVVPSREEGEIELVWEEDEEDEEEDEDEDEEEDEESDDVAVVTERKAARYRAARSDAKVSTIRATIEEVFGLPAGSVALCGPDGRPLRGHARIRTLRKRWEDS